MVGDSFENHLYNLVGVLKRLKEAGLKVKPSKCSLCPREVQYLGHVVSAEDPTKVEAICNWPTPTCKQEIQCFSGLANYHRCATVYVIITNALQKYLPYARNA